MSERGLHVVEAQPLLTPDGAEALTDLPAVGEARFVEFCFVDPHGSLPVDVIAHRSQ